MRPIMMRYRANNIMFNKQTTATSASAAQSHHTTPFDSIWIRREFISFFFVEYLKKILFWLYVLFIFRSINFYIGLFYCSMRRHENTTTTIFTHTIYMMILCGPTESNKYKFQKYDYHTWLLYSNDSFRISLSLFSLAIVVVVVVVLWVVGFFMRAAISYLFATKHHFSYGCWTLSWFCVLNNGQFSFFTTWKPLLLLLKADFAYFWPLLWM